MEISRPYKICGLIINSRHTSLVTQPVSAVIINQEMNNAKLWQQALNCSQYDLYLFSKQRMGPEISLHSEILVIRWRDGVFWDSVVTDNKSVTVGCCLNYNHTLQTMRHEFKPTMNQYLNHGDLGLKCTHLVSANAVMAILLYFKDPQFATIALYNLLGICGW